MKWFFIGTLWLWLMYSKRLHWENNDKLLVKVISRLICVEKLQSYGVTGKPEGLESYIAYQF